MTGEQNAIHTLDDAFAALEMQQQAHSKRVSKYAEIIYTYAEAHDIYLNTPRAEKELTAENIPLMAAAGLYHQIGAGSMEDEIPYRVQDSVDLFDTLCAATKRYKAAEKKWILTAISEQYERMDGNGYPAKKNGNDISFMGRVLALAHDLDEISMKLVSENPLEDALKQMKAGVPGKYDPEFYKAMKNSKAKLNRVFKSDIQMSHAVPAVEPIIKRRVTRPMELVYRPFCNGDGEIIAREAAMRFRNVKDNTLPYEEVKHIIQKQGLGEDICEYFLFEACDTVRRFEACGMDKGWIGLGLLPVFYGKKKLAKRLQDIYETTGVSTSDIRILISANALKKPTKALAENVRECRKKGIFFVLTDVTRAFLEETMMTWEEYPFAAIRFTSECLMDHTIQESPVFLNWKECGIEILVDDIENQSILEVVAENGAEGYTGLYAGIYEREDDIVKRALQFYS